MENSDKGKLTYAAAGVDIDAATETKTRIRRLARETFTPGVVSDIGSFGSMFRFDSSRYRDPVLVSSCDGVGTKLKVAFMTGIHDSVGYDLVSHCVSDIMVQGARPLFFLDYIACGRLEPGIVEKVVSGLSRACRETGCALIGGETAEMPDFYAPGEYDLAGFIVGIVDRGAVIDGSKIRPGDRLLGLASLGLHTNGYSLARKLFFEKLGMRHDTVVPELQQTVGSLLLAPHRSYARMLDPLLDCGLLKGLAHITGGGITDNLPRILPEGTAAEIVSGSWPVLPLFHYIQSKGEIDDEEMARTFNLGVGMIIAAAPESVEDLRRHFDSFSEPLYEIGRVIEGDGTVHYCRS